MASLTSPDWRGFLGRAPVPAGSVPAPSVDPAPARVNWYAKQPTAPLPAVFPSWWPAGWPPQTTPSPHPSRLEAGATSRDAGRDAGVTDSRLLPYASRPASGATNQPPPPPTRPAPAQAQPQPVPPRGPRPLSPRLLLALKWAVAGLPEEQRAEVFSDLLETLRFRAASEQPCSLESDQPIGRKRFGLAGETLVPEGTLRVRRRLEDEVREILRTCEMRLSRTRRNHYLAMHSARLDQLWRELETRFDIEVLEEVKSALGRCWA